MNTVSVSEARMKLSDLVDSVSLKDRADMESFLQTAKNRLVPWGWRRSRALNT